MPKRILSYISADDVLKGAAASLDAEIKADVFEKEIVFYKSDESNNKRNRSRSYVAGKRGRIRFQATRFEYNED